jgi:hypothetical protein
VIQASVGNVNVMVANNRTHTPEEWAEMATDQIIFVGGNSHPVIVDQARAYREQIKNTLVHYFNLAQEAERNALLRRL